MAGLLLTVFGGITDRLIPLFAVGAFMAFTLSQLGMAFHWVREQGNRGHLWINGTGAAGTGLALAIILSAKFVEGAWITVLVIPLVLGMLKAIKRHYELIDRQLREEGPIDLRGLQPPIVLIPLERWDRLAEKAVRLRCCCRARSSRSISRGSKALTPRSTHRPAPYGRWYKRPPLRPRQSALFILFSRRYSSRTPNIRGSAKPRTPANACR
jgi:hypothetical protein